MTEETRASGAATFTDAQRATFEGEVAGRFGLVPNFFQTASEQPGLIAQIWGFAKSAYLDNPLPSVFKERLFVHLSRFCEVRYCIVRHVGFLVGKGNVAGDPDAEPHTVQQVLDLLRGPGLPDRASLEASLSRLESASPPWPIPAPQTREEQDVFAAAALLFLRPAEAERARKALYNALGGPNFELVVAFLAFIRTAHYWTITHPELVFEEDMEELMARQEELAGLLLCQPGEGERCDLGQRLYDELVALRAERDDREALRKALAEREEAQRRQQLLINELNHRVKNTLAIIQSIATQTLRNSDTPPDVRETFMARLMALADAHDILTEESWEGAELGALVAKAVGMHGEVSGNGRVRLSGPDIRLAPKSAVVLSMAVHELVTNATKYGALSNDRGLVDVDWRIAGDGDRLLFTWIEADGPTVEPPTRKGFGSRLIERGLAEELQGIARIDYRPSGAVCTIDAPLPTAVPR